ncbi:unnamed protein product [Didymodactylos carnosus]|uniref:RRM domain-containing protein n=1 Tax=Didymodactylos carnosus TaxID=1234261 RepID=A0A813PYH5_9BILA|nr:unnamed protein product [Didymodactylos carnosus]CAF0981898.1 unnamed protein product [Didymodactylos carnosus]CAF3540696.1 unnamed protein product [Didymodactylos carnosus]CAF3752462.1 unnamed protein product [Didymodactylos carnosus]
MTISLALGVIIAVGILLSIQLRNIIRNRTGIENLVLQRATEHSHRTQKKVIYPCDLGFKSDKDENIRWSDQRTQDHELTELFKPFGKILEASVIKDYGFVHYGSIEEAEKAAFALNNKEYKGKKIRVELSTSTVRHRPGEPTPTSGLRQGGRSNRGGGGGNGRFGGGGPMRGHDSRQYGGGNNGYNQSYDRSRPYPDQGRFNQRDNGNSNSNFAAFNVPQNRGGGGSYNNHNLNNFNNSQGDYRGYGQNQQRTDNFGGRNMYDRGGLGPNSNDSFYSGMGGNTGSSMSQQNLPPQTFNSQGYDQSYDRYQQYYPNKPRDSEFSNQSNQQRHLLNQAELRSATLIHVLFRNEYDYYSNYRSDPYSQQQSHTPSAVPPSILTQQPQRGPPQMLGGGQPSGRPDYMPYDAYTTNMSSYYGQQQQRT